MEVILLDHIDKVGDKHDVVKVKDGFGRNYLIPQGLAIVANKSNMARLDGLKKQEARKEMAKVNIYQDFANTVAKAKIQIIAKAGESGRLFGSVGAQQLAEAIRALGVEVEKRHIKLQDDIKELGSYTATLAYHPQVTIDFNFDVVTEAGAAKAEANAEPVAAEEAEQGEE